jgi:hypothetical protein
MSAISVTQMKHAHLGKNTSPRCSIRNRNNVLATVIRNGFPLAQRRRCGSSDSAFLHLCNLSGFLDLVIFSTNEHEATVRYPRWHWMSLRIWAAPAWDDMISFVERVSYGDKCI